MSVQSREGASNPDGIDYKDYPFRKLEKEGDKIKGKIVAQSNWIPTDQGGTRRIINLVNGDDKSSCSIASAGKKRAIADALEDAGGSIVASMRLVVSAKRACASAAIS